MKLLSSGQYYGTKNSEFKIDGILCSEYNYHAQKTDWHYHEHPYFMYVLQGRLNDINKKKTTYCGAGSLVLMNWQEPHFNSKHTKDARGFHLEFNRQWFSKYQLDIELWEGSSKIDNPNLHHLIAKLYYEYNCQDAFSAASIEILLFQICESLSAFRTTESTTKPSWVQKLVELINDVNEPTSLTYLSQEIGVHPGHISRAVPKFLSTTLGDFIRQSRVKKALSLLLTSGKPMSEITYECGFSDQSHFIKTFRNYIGMTPSQYQKQINK